MLNVIIFETSQKSNFIHQISSLDCVCNIFKSAHGYYIFIFNFDHSLFFKK